MTDITITVSSELATLFPTAVNHYNIKHNTSYNNQTMIKLLAINFIYDELYALYHDTAEENFLTQLIGVPEYEN